VFGSAKMVLLFPGQVAAVTVERGAATVEEATVEVEADADDVIRDELVTTRELVETIEEELVEKIGAELVDATEAAACFWFASAVELVEAAALIVLVEVVEGAEEGVEEDAGEELEDEAEEETAAREMNLAPWMPWLP